MIFAPVWEAQALKSSPMIALLVLFCACGSSSPDTTPGNDIPDAVEADLMNDDAPLTDLSGGDLHSQDVVADTTMDAEQDVPFSDVPPADVPLVDTPAEDIPVMDLPGYEVVTDVPVFTSFQAIESFPDLLIGTWQSGYGYPTITFVTPQTGLDQYGLGYLLVPDHRDPANPTTRAFCFDYGISSSAQEGYRLIRDFKMVTIPGVTCGNDIEDSFSYTGYYDNDRYTDFVCTDGNILSFHCLHSEPMTRSDPDFAGLWEMEEGWTDGYGTVYPNDEDLIVQITMSGDGSYVSRDYDCSSGGGESWDRGEIACPSSGFEGTWSFADGELTFSCTSEIAPCIGLTEPLCSCTHARVQGTYKSLLLQQKGRRFIGFEASAEGFWYKI